MNFKSIKENFSKAKVLLYDRLPLLGVIGSTCSILAFIFGAFSKKTWVLAPGYAVFAISLSAIAFWEMHHRKNAENESENTKQKLNKVYSKMRVYESKANSFHLAFHMLREANTLLMASVFLDGDRNARFIGCLSESLSHFSDFFSQLTEHQCSLCIKLLIKPNKEQMENYNAIKFATFVRDRKSQWRSAEDEMEYTLGKNTAFRSIWLDRRWFYSSDLSKEQHYDNENEKWHKKHHYLTTLVVPIQAPKISIDEQEYQGIKGYLAMDSSEPNAFLEEPTIYLLACMADILYISLMYYKSLGKEPKNANAGVQ